MIVRESVTAMFIGGSFALREVNGWSKLSEVVEVGSVCEYKRRPDKEWLSVYREDSVSSRSGDDELSLPILQNGLTKSHPDKPIANRAAGRRRKTCKDQAIKSWSK